MHKQKATSIVLQINNTVQKIRINDCTLVKSQYHVNSSTADGTTTSLTEHFVRARLTETLVATWHQRDACVTFSHEADLATVVVDSCYILCSCAGVGTNCCWLIETHQSSSTSLSYVQLSVLRRSRIFQSRIFRSRIFSAAVSTSTD